MSGVLVMAKSPVPGRVKTRLAATVGDAAAADLAAAALLDTLAAARKAFPGRCYLALDGDLAEGCRFTELAAAIEDMEVFAQVPGTLGERIAAAWRVLGASGARDLVQIGMDTPQVTSSDLVAAVTTLERFEAGLGRAADGGWWALALRDPAQVTPISQVVMSTARTGQDTRDVLVRAGLRVADLSTQRDVDLAGDAEAVVRYAPHTEFARAWAEWKENAGDGDNLR